MAAGLLQSPPPPVLRPVNGHVEPPRPPSHGDGGEGEPSPRRPFDNLRLALVFFIGAEAMFFAALISSLFVLRTSLPVWPPPLQPRLPIGITTANTVVLLASSAAMALATRALARHHRREVVRWLAAAGVLGALFLVVQGSEWVRLISHGLTMSSSTYGTTFYTLIGTHALHVVGALAWLIATAGLAARGRGGARAPLVRGCALYWHFVVALWLILFVAVYLV
jgi:heme/copper-type cytochrome/quinol oxidase subunit 3